MTMKRLDRRKQFLFTPQLERIVTEAIYPYHLLRAEQITRLLYPTKKLGMLTTVQSRLLILVREKYLIADQYPTKSGPRPYIYALGINGRRLCEERGFNVDIYYEPNELGKLTFTRDHTLELNDVLTLAAALPVRDPRVGFSDLEHSLLFEKKPLEYLDRATGGLRTIKPDALFKFHIQRSLDSEKHLHCWVELDRGYVKDDMMMKKYANIHDYIKREFFADHFGKGQPRVFFVTTAGTKRLEHLRALFRREFPRINPHSGTNHLFKFAELPSLMEPKPLPEAVFCQPYWQTAYGDPSDLQTIINENENRNS